jgi:vacuolar-type H+-ATPase subunit F/Vma7
MGRITILGGKGAFRLLPYLERSKMKFYFKKPKPIFIIIPDSSVTVNIGGVDTLIKNPAKVIQAKGGFLDTAIEKKKWGLQWGMEPDKAEQLVLNKLRRNPRYNTPFMKELTEKDEKVIAINERKRKEAQEEIARLDKEIPIIPKVEEKKPVLK